MNTKTIATEPNTETGVPVTPQLWEKIENKLLSPYGTVELICDGHRVGVFVERYQGLSFRLVVYVDGYWRGEWMRNCPDHVRKVWRLRERFIHTKKERDRMKKHARSRDAYLRKLAADADKKIGIRSPDWPNPKSFIRQIKKACAEIRVLKIGLETYSEAAS
jgi:hypothetical protein